MNRLRLRVASTLLIVFGVVLFATKPATAQQIVDHTSFGAPLNCTAAACNYNACNPPAQPQVPYGRCQTCGVGIDCADNCGKRRQSWRDLHPYNFSPLAHGEWIGPVRIPSNLNYRIRVGDTIRFIYILSREVKSSSFPLRVGDELHISSLTDPSVQLGDVTQGKGVVIQQDGKLYMKLIEPVTAAGLTIDQLRETLEVKYTKKIRTPSIDVIPIKTNTLLQDIRDSVDARNGQGGQSFIDSVHPDGTLRLPKLGAICVLGMTLDEIKREVNLRYNNIVEGLEIEPILEQEASHFVFVYGQVARPGRFEMTGPTTVTQALALAEGVQRGGNNRQIVVMRRAEDWRLIATRLDLGATHLGKDGLPSDEIWLRDGDLIIVPKTPIQRFDDFVQQVFQQGAYGIFPFAQVGSGFDIGAGVVGGN
ncbi:MAG: polysaccharide biosynthesis/export family protein [Planctomycetota bacterium]